MRVFVTGGSGHLGSAAIPELLSAGHQVLALARSDRSAQELEAAGAGVHRGSLDDPDTLREAAAAADGVIHLAFRHDAMQAGDFAGASTPTCSPSRRSATPWPAAANRSSAPLEP